MMTLIYRIILAGIVALIGWDLFTEKKLTLQLNAAHGAYPAGAACFNDQVRGGLK